jgi:hypothetical protein
MSKFEWPGIATATVIVLILTLIILGLRDDFHLKDWQPLMAAVIALGGGAFAYRGARLAYDAAMTKVRTDVETIDRREKRDALGIGLRLSFAVHVTEGEAENMSIYLADRLDPMKRTIKTSELRFSMLRDLDEAWKRIDVLPRQAAMSFFNLRIAILNFQGNVGDEEQIEMTSFAPPPKIKQLRSDLAVLRAHAATLLKEVHNFSNALAELS